MRIHQDFIGGNISVKEINGDTVFLENQLRDTTEDWFYWAFCIEGAENRTITFHLQSCRLGYFGPAVSHDLETWHWLDSVDENSFTYRFGEAETKVYFAHSMLYHPKRFYAFAEKHNIAVEELCKGYRGSSVPCIKLGDGETGIVLTARHHACESTGSYVLEGVLEELIAEPIPSATVFCVPFVDYEGVIRGDQGKSRAPHDHNRDYGAENEPIYPECRAIREYAAREGCHFGFDFHSPWHRSGINDCVFIVQSSEEQLEKLNHFGEILEANITENALQYEHKNDYPPNTGWNRCETDFANHMQNRKENILSLTLETAYFGTPQNKVSAENLVELGRCFAKALKEYIRESRK
ncbi:MAG: carboxypeptidase family protein [Ruminococcaceae bacterium]|nr:carboxypeptidase family protein [Oscillospiraceae bacterium]